MLSELKDLSIVLWITPRMIAWYEMRMWGSWSPLGTREDQTFASRNRDGAVPKSDHL